VCKCCFTVRGLIFNWPAISFSKARPSPILRIPRRRPLRPVVMGTQGHEPGFSGELQDTCVRLAELHNGPTTRPMSRNSAANGAFGSRSKAGNRVICPSRQASSGPEPVPDLGLGHEAKESQALSYHVVSRYEDRRLGHPVGRATQFTQGLTCGWIRRCLYWYVAVGFWFRFGRWS
jgi:hypothetical protein